MEPIKAVRGSACDYDEYLDFINMVFGFNGQENDFYKLLPKLYRKEYDPCASNYIIKDNGRIVCAVGAYDEEYSVCGETLHFRGIGNVAAHPRAKGKGYMRVAMDAAMADMKPDGVDFSALGGLRHRYGYWSFEIGGHKLQFYVGSDDIKHAFGQADESVKVAITPLKREDTDTIAQLVALREKLPMFCRRTPERAHDVMCSWKSTPYVITVNGELAGSMIRSGSTLHDILLTEPSLLREVLRAWHKSFGNVTVVLPPYETEMIKTLCKISSGSELRNGESYTVFCFERVCRALLKLRGTYEPLADGELRVLVHGVAGDENLLIRVTNGVPEVTLTEEAPDLELEHKAAMLFFFNLYSPDRLKLEAAPKSWLPLPLYTDNADEV